MSATAALRLTTGETSPGFGQSDALWFLQGVPDAVLVADEAGRVVFANPAAEALFDHAGGSLVDLPARILIRDWTNSPDDAARSRQIETAAVRRDGSAVPVEASFVAWHDGGRRLTGAMLRSILDHKVSEAMLEEARAQAEAAEAEARTAHARLAEVVELQPHAICVLDAQDRYVLWNRRYVELYPEIADMLRPGADFLDILRASVDSGTLAEAVDDPETWLAYRMAKHELPAIQEEQQMRDGRWMRYDDRRLSDGGTIAVRVDITDLKRREESFRLLFQENPVPMLLIEPETLSVLAVNDAAIRHYGFGLDAFLAMTAADLHVAEERARAECAFRLAGPVYEVAATWRHRRADGGEIAVMMFIRAIVHDGRPGMLAAIVDVTERVRAEARIAHLAHHDALTGLANRIRFHQALQAALARPGEDGDAVVLFCLDLDGFKPINDTYGHAAGDAVLRLVADRLRSAVHDTDVVARLGGDEFAVIHRSSRDGLDPVAECAGCMAMLLGAPCEAGGRTVTIGVSIGIAIAEPGEDPDRLLARADAALYEAKAAGRNTWRVWEEQVERPPL